MENLTNIQKIHVGSRTFLLPEQMTHLDADCNYTIVNLQDGSKIISPTNLSKIEKRLTEHKNFVRVNKSIIVNLNYVETIESGFVLNDNRLVLFSRRKGKAWKEQMTA
jgi:DNA-binding LytR/AlgR family response regulator